MPSSNEFFNTWCACWIVIHAGIAGSEISHGLSPVMSLGLLILFLGLKAKIYSIILVERSQK